MCGKERSFGIFADDRELGGMPEGLQKKACLPRTNITIRLIYCEGRVLTRFCGDVRMLARSGVLGAKRIARHLRRVRLGGLAPLMRSHTRSYVCFVRRRI